MDILYTTTISKPGNDCYIEKSISLIEVLGMYSVITATRITGWWGDEQISASTPTFSYTKALHWYKELGGTIDK